MFRQLGIICLEIPWHKERWSQEQYCSEVTDLIFEISKEVNKLARDSIRFIPQHSGGQITFAEPFDLASMAEFVISCRSWGTWRTIPLRMSLAIVSGVILQAEDSQPRLIGENVSECWALLAHSSENRVIASKACQELFAHESSTRLEFHDSRKIAGGNWPTQEVFLCSITDGFRSKWDDPLGVPSLEDRIGLESAIQTRRVWDQVYYAKRLLQTNAHDKQATQLLLSCNSLELCSKGVDEGPSLPNPVLEKMNPHCRLAFIRASQLIERETGEILCTQGDEGDTMFLILRGTVGVFKKANNLDPMICYGEGELVGELAFALQRDRTATLQCMSKCAILGFSYEQFVLLSRHSAFGDSIQKHMREFIKGRVLNYVSHQVDFIVGPRGDGPLGKVKDPWMYLQDYSEIISLSWKSSESVSRSHGRFETPGVYILLGGSLGDQSSPERRLTGRDLPVVFAEVGGTQLVPNCEYTVEVDARILFIRAEAFENQFFDLGDQTEFVSAFLKGIAKPAHPEPRLPAEEAFSWETVLYQFPAPIALPYQRFCQYSDQRDPTGRLKRLFLAFESMIKYLTFISLCDLFQMLREKTARTAFHNHPAFAFLCSPTRMSLGKWVEALRETSRTLATFSNRFLRELPLLCSPDGEFAKNILNWITSNRNLVEHPEGGLPLSEEDCRRLLRTTRSKLEQAFQQIDFLRSYPLGYLSRRTAHAPQEKTCRYRSHRLTGASSYGGDEGIVFETEFELPVEIPFLVTHSGKLLCLWPFLFVRMSELSSRKALFVFERLADRGRNLSSVEATAIDSKESREEKLLPQEASELAWIWRHSHDRPLVVQLPNDSTILETLSGEHHGNLIGKYLGENRLVALIARGGSGTVYAAHTPTGHQLAIKVLHLQDGRNPQVDRFKREFDQALKMSTHEHIVRCYEFKTTVLDGREYTWFSMELAVSDLRDRIVQRQSHGAITPWEDPSHQVEIIDEFTSILCAVRELHSHGLIHRDIKPANILVTNGGEFRLADFGLAKSLNDHGLTSTGAILGTRRYMSPEQWEGGEVGLASDVFSLGVVFAELATGTQINRNTSVENGSSLDSCNAVRLLPHPIQQFIHKCTQVSVEMRYQDAMAVQAAFESVLQGNLC